MESKKKFLDKNPLFDYGRYKLFNEMVRIESLNLIEQIMSGNFEIYLTPDTPFSLYNYLKYKLERPRIKGGKDLSIEEAEEKSRKFVREIFEDGGWKLVALDLSDLTCAFADERFEEAEDALQFYAAKKIDAIFITWNTRHFMNKGLKVLTPKMFLERFRIKDNK